MKTFSPLRAAICLGVASCLLLAGIGRVAYLQTETKHAIAGRVERQTHLSHSLQARRGSIFDSAGQLLAGSVQSTTLFVDPKFTIDQSNLRPGGNPQLEADLIKLGELIDVDGFELLHRISEKYPERYLEIAHHVDERTLAEVQKLRIPGVGTTPAGVRLYPAGSMAAHVLGGVGRDGRGIEGIELVYDKLLSGTPGRVRSVKDARRRAIGTQVDDYTPPEHGRHIVLTLDSSLQSIVEQELSRTLAEFGAPRGEAVLLDPRSGAILAMASVPTFSPQFIEESTAEQRTNGLLVLPYEPGSTLKPLIVAAALDAGVTTAGEVWPIDGPRWKTDYGRTITDVHGYERLATWDVLVKSSNIGMSQLAERMGQKSLADSLRRFGLGRVTDIDLPGEDDGMVNPLKRWTRHSTESIAQGYELLVTPMQMARAMCAIANGGELVQPHLLAGTLESDGTIRPYEREPVPMEARSISPEAAAIVRRILADTPVRGTARAARSQLYTIFGKTGTAHRAVNGSYNEANYTASFVGGAPYESPRLVVAVVVHDPDKSRSHFGGVVAAPCAGRILERSLQHLRVPPSPPLAPPPESVASRLYNFDPKAYQTTPPDDATAADDMADVRD